MTVQLSSLPVPRHPEHIASNQPAATENRETRRLSALSRRLRLRFIRATGVLVAAVGLASGAAAQGRTDCGALTSAILGRAVHYCIMLPAGYKDQGGESYPVLYFLHGLGENEQALLRSGGWGLIEDLREEGKTGDFILAAPEGRGSFFINSARGGERYSDFFLSEFLPFVESRYHARRDRRTRGITGLSMGGYGALRYAFAHPEVFGSVSAQSPALVTESPREIDARFHEGGPLAGLLGTVFGNPIDLPHWKENNPFELARRKRIEIRNEAIYINCGVGDEYGFASGAVKLHEQLVAEGVQHEFHLYAGGHSAEYFLSHLGETMRFHWKAFHAAGRRVR
jgi:S-formylglutathione hydrolase FrmB